VPSARFTEIANAVRNWGRWGSDDRLGTLNLLDEAARRRGAASVVTGEAFPLGLGLAADQGIQAGFIEGRVEPTRRMTVVNGPLSADPDWICSSEDELTMGIQAATHWDGLGHVSYGGHLYNGYPASSVDATGSTILGIERLSTVIGRGVLLDLAALHGVDALTPGYGITPADLDAAEELAGVRVEPGDLLLLRTGQMAALDLDPAAPYGHPGPNRDKIAYTFPSAGCTMESALWFHDRGVAAVANDTLTFEVFPGENDEDYLPVHLLHLVEMGLTQGQNFFLDRLAAACAADGRYTFLLDATPLPLTGAVGTPLNPVALR
jgi:kynurenine formamidase